MFIDKIPIRYRLSLGHAVWMSVLFSAVGFGLYRLVEKNLVTTIDGALHSTVDIIREEIRKKQARRTPFDKLLRNYFLDYPLMHSQVINISGKITNQDARGEMTLPTTSRALHRAQSGLETIENFPYYGTILRQLTVPVMHRGKFSGELIQVAASVDSVRQTLKHLRFFLWSLLPVVLAIAIFIGYVLTARSLKPVAAISSAAAKLDAEDLETRLVLPKANDELRELTETFNHMLDRLGDSFMRLRRFTGDVSHELRTPLTVLKGEAELALLRDRTPERYREALKTIVAESKNMSIIIEDLLLLARAQSNSIDLKLEPISVNRFMEQITTELQPLLAPNNLKIDLSLKGPSEFLAGASYLSLALKNLITNAIKHSPVNSVIEFDYRAEKGESICFSVKDFGEGIAADDIPFIFDTFYRADTSRNRKTGGVGIGLSLAKALVSLHGGQIKVTSGRSESGAASFGACFEVCLPYKTQY